MPATTKIWTESELMALPKDGFRYELVNGEISKSPTGDFLHGLILAMLTTRITSFVYANKMGVAFDGQSGFWMKSGNLRSTDYSFVAQTRAKQMKLKSPRGFLHGSPDLAIEVLSPNESAKSIAERMAEYFENDTKLAWVIDPDAKTIAVYRSATPDKMLHSGDTLDGERVVPGFTVSVDDVFAEPDLD